MAEFWEMVHVQNFIPTRPLPLGDGKRWGYEIYVLKKCQTEMVVFFSSPHFLDPPPHPLTGQITAKMQKVAFWKGNVGEILFHLARFDFCWGVCPFGARALWWMACPAWEMPRAARWSLVNCAWTMHDMNFWSIPCWNGANWRLPVMIFVGGMCVKLKFENKNL